MARRNAILALVVFSAAVAACDTAPETAAPSSEINAAVMAPEQAAEPGRSGGSGSTASAACSSTKQVVPLSI